MATRRVNEGETIFTRLKIEPTNEKHLQPTYEKKRETYLLRNYRLL